MLSGAQATTPKQNNNGEKKVEALGMDDFMLNGFEFKSRWRTTAICSGSVWCLRKRVVWICHQPHTKLQHHRLWNPSLIISQCVALTFPVPRSYLQSRDWFLLQLCHAIAGRSTLHHKVMKKKKEKRKKKNVTANWKISTRRYWLSLHRSIVAQLELAGRGTRTAGKIHEVMHWKVKAPWGWWWRGQWILRGLKRWWVRLKNTRARPFKVTSPKKEKQ